MPEKLLSLQELSEYLNIPEQDLKKLANERVIPSYIIGGSFLRFRKEQIDAIKDEILARIPQTTTPTYRIKVDLEKKEAKIESTETVGEKLLDFVYFSDFYIISALLITLMLFVIFKM